MSIKSQISKNQVKQLKEDYNEMVGELKNFVRLALYTEHVLGEIESGKPFSEDTVLKLDSIKNALKGIREVYVVGGEDVEVESKVENG